MLPINTYLKYNNVALLDPTQPYHASCIKQYKEKGYLSNKQLAQLRSWCHSADAIQRLTSTEEEEAPEVESSTNYSTPFDESDAAPVSKSPSRPRWTDEDDNTLFELLKQQPSKENLLAVFPNRSLYSIQQRAYKLGGYYRKGIFHI